MIDPSPRRKSKYATPKPGSPVIIGQWSLRRYPGGGRPSFALCWKGSGSSYWNHLVQIYQTKGGCFIVSSTGTEEDAHACWSVAVDDAIARAAKHLGVEP